MKFCITLLLFFLTAYAASHLTIKNSAAATCEIVDVIADSVKYLVPVTEVCSKLGYKWQWDRYTQRLVLSANSTRISFVQGNCFYNVNDSILKLPVAPQRIGATLYLPVELLVEILRSRSTLPLRYDGAQHVLYVNSKENTVLSVLCDKKQNGTLVTISLADSVIFEYSYTFPKLVISFPKGTIDTQLIHLSSQTGVIDSLYASQVKDKARITFVLNREINEPKIDYAQDSKTLLLSLRSKPVQGTKVPQKSPQVDVEGIKTVVIDPGHGGKDPGCLGDGGIREKEITLGIALQLRDILKKKSRINVFMTRDKDVFIPLNERTRMANDKKADLFVSIHVNSIPGSAKRKEATRGYKIYFLSQAKNEEDKLVAMQENAVIKLEDKPQNYSNLKNVLIDLAGNEYLRESQDLCIILDHKLDSSLKKKIPKLQLGIGQANFWVLNGAYMPSVLIETGFISHSNEEKLLSDNAVQKEIATAIAEAIVTFKGKYETGL